MFQMKHTEFSFIPRFT